MVDRTAADYASDSGFKDIASKLRNITAKPGFSNTSVPKVNDNHDNEDSDTWNDSPVSTPSVKQKKIDKHMMRVAEQFLQESDLSGPEDRSGSETSARSSVRKSENGSPQSGVIPPPCKPLRSIEYLQSGRQEETPSTSARPVHLMTLGSVRSRHISMTDQAEKKKYETLPHR